MRRDDATRPDGPVRFHTQPPMRKSSAMHESYFGDNREPTIFEKKMEDTMKFDDPLSRPIIALAISVQSKAKGEQDKQSTSIKPEFVAVILPAELQDSRPFVYRHLKR